MKNGGQSSTRKKKRARLSTVIVILLAIAGICVMLYPTASDMVFRWQASREIAQYNAVSEGSDVDYSEMWAAAEEYNRQLAENGTFSASVSADEADYISQLLNPLGTGMMGYIDIPAINVHIPIYQGTDEAALQAGAGFWLGTSLPTGGAGTHCVLTAHNGLTKAKMFTDIDQLEIGDTFTITVLDRTLTYEVDQILVVEPDDFSAMTIIEGEDHVTLYTCTPYGVNTHRLLVRGTRVESTTDTTSGADVITVISEIVTDTDIRDVILVVLVLLLVILIALLISVLMPPKKKRRRRAKNRKIKESPEEKEGSIDEEKDDS
ncbi:MAG: class C sortase [Firmicutes bacterium]|nr:class C sortase [Bacillota bacterium]